MRWIPFWIGCIVLSGVVLASDGKLVVHEWGTFTSLQDERGRTIGGINTDDEPVPKFVHSISSGLLLSPSEIDPAQFKAAPSCLRNVTMRLETPVLYFHSDKDFHGKVDVKVEFKGGWLSQFYPDAIAVAPGLKDPDGTRLKPDTLGSLFWKDLEINAAGKVPETNAHVWLAPRKVDALPVKTEKGECEQYIFYRGIGNIDAPLRVSRNDNSLRIDATVGQKPINISRLWYVDIRANGTAAYRTIEAAKSAKVAETPAAFAETDYSAKTVAVLRDEMRGALKDAGLFADEAEALLNTWELSYFKSFGARMFFLVPTEWTETYLPLSISGHSCETTRVMVGRIEIVSPQQRELLKKLAIAPPILSDAEKAALEAKRLKDYAIGVKNWADISSGSKTYSDLGIEVPGTYGTYLKLGRFRNALVLDEQKNSPSEVLAGFIRQHALEGH